MFRFRMFVLFTLLTQQVYAQAPNFCPVENFNACGGRLSGTYKLEALCTESPAVQPPCEFPFDQEKSCQGPGNTVACRLNVDGFMTFDEQNVHVQRTEFIEARYTLTSACTAAVRPKAGSAAARCKALSRLPIMTCSLEQDLCVCQSKIQGEPLDETVEYSATSPNLKFAEWDATYCAADGRLTLNFEPHPRSWKYWVLTPVPGP